MSFSRMSTCPKSHSTSEQIARYNQYNLCLHVYPKQLWHVEILKTLKLMIREIDFYLEFLHL